MITLRTLCFLVLASVASANILANKTATGTCKRTFTWNHHKTLISPTSNPLIINPDQAYNLTYRIDLNRTFVVSDCTVSGRITLFCANCQANPGTPLAFNVTDTLVGDGAAVVRCPKFTLVNNETLICTYTVTNASASATQNQAVISSTTAGVVTVTANFAYGFNDIDECVSVQDTITGITQNAVTTNFGLVCDSNFTSPIRFSATLGPIARCNQAPDTVTNDARITTIDTATKQSSIVNLAIQCVEPLDVSKTAQESITQTCVWSVAKSVNPTGINLAVGASANANYQVTLSRVCTPTFHLRGDIQVCNPSQTASATVYSVRDIFNGVNIAVRCFANGADVVFPYVLAKNKCIACNYSQSFDQNENPISGKRWDGPNRAIVNSTSGVQEATAPVDFTNATTTFVGACGNLTDSLQGPLGRFCQNEVTTPRVITYSRVIGPYPTCGPRDVRNVATFTTDEGKSSNGTAVVNVLVLCPTTSTSSSSGPVSTTRQPTTTANPTSTTKAPTTASRTTAAPTTAEVKTTQVQTTALATTKAATTQLYTTKANPPSPATTGDSANADKDLNSGAMIVPSLFAVMAIVLLIAMN